MRQIRIGAGAGYSGDRIEPAVELAEKGDLHYLVFECLAERTIALAQQAKLQGSGERLRPAAAERLRAVLPLCHAKGVRIITNMGAANPIAAAETHPDSRPGAGPVEPEDRRRHRRRRPAAICPAGPIAWTKQEPPLPSSATGSYRPMPTSEHSPSSEALASGADIVITGRAADPSLFLGPLVHEFGWGVG